MAKRKPKTKAKSPAANDARFWKRIEEARQADDFILTLTENLEDSPEKEIIAFQNTLQRKVAEAYKFPVLAANFIIQSYVSDDVFEDFRAWLVSQGQKRFQAAIANPETICDWLQRDEVDEIDGESFLFAAEHAYEEYGVEEDFWDQIKRPRKPALKLDWPENKAGYQKRWPRLVAKFWNQERIKELHGG